MMEYAMSRRLVSLALLTVGLLLLGWVEGSALVSKTFSFSTSDLSFSEIQGYDLVSLPGCDYMSDVGKPALPVMMVKFAIPTDNTVTGFTVSDEETEEVSGTYLIYPAQELARLDFSPPPEFVPPDPAVYESPDPFPGILVELSDEGYFAGSKLATISLYPLQWVPTSGKLTLSTHFTITLELGPSADWSQPVGRRTQDMHDRYIQMTKGLVENPEQVEGFANQPEIVDESEFGEQGPHTCVIITPEALQEQFEPLRDWNRRRGLRTQIVWVEWIVANYPAYDDPHSIRNFIKEYYSWYGTEWVLLGGDADNVPVRNRHCADVPADVYYSALDGTWDIDGDGLYGECHERYDIDYYPEVSVGRTQVVDQAEAELFVNKVIAYQQDPRTCLGPADFLLMGAWLDETTSGGMKSNMIVSYLPPDVTFWRMYDDLYEPPPPRNQQIRAEPAIQRLNQGFYLINHVGHGGFTRISVSPDENICDECIYSSDLDNLTNDGHGIFSSIACYSAAFDKPPEQCFGKHWLTNPDGGGIAYLGNSRYGYYWPFHLSLGPSCRLTKWFYEFLYDDPFRENTRAIGRAFARAKDRAQHMPSQYLYILCSWNLLGDPTMPVWTEEPLTLSVSHPVAVPADFSTGFAISVTDEFGPVQDASVCLYKEGHIYEVEYTDAAGSVVIPLSPTSEQMGEMLVTVSKVGHIPYLGSCWITLGATQSHATALNNAKRFMMDGEHPDEFDILFLSEKPAEVYNSYSYDPQKIWVSQSIAGGWYGVLSVAKGPGHPVLKAVWRDGDNLLYSSRDVWPGWGDVHTLFVQQPPLTGVSAPSFAIDTLTTAPEGIVGRAYVAWQSVWYEGEPPVPKRKYYVGWFEPGSGPVSPFFQYWVFDTLTGTVPLPDFSGPSVGVDPDPDTYRPYVHIAWEKNGEVYYLRGSPGGLSHIVNVSQSPGVLSDNPCLDIHRSVVRIVWEEAGDILYRSMAGGVLGDIENVSQSLFTISVRPVVERSFVAWSEQVGTDYEIFLRRRGIGGWTDVENVSNSPLAPSTHPQLFYRPCPASIHDDLHIMWTEGTESPYCIRFDKRAVPAENIHVYNLGEPEPSPITIERDGYIDYGPWWMYETVDYDSTVLKYHLSGLDPDNNYQLEAIYYHQLDGSLVEKIEVDQAIAEETMVPPNTPVKVTVNLPAGSVADGEIAVAVSELSGDLAICSVLILWESLGSGGGSQAAGPAGFAPRVNALSQNFPNPTSGNTTIKYQLATEVEVNLTIYDVAGRLVGQLLNEREVPGLYATTWDGRDSSGEQVASGVYFYRLVAGDFAATRKMVLLR